MRIDSTAPNAGAARLTPKALLAAIAAVAIGITGFSTASVAQAAEPKMTWSIESTEPTVPSGGAISYSINLECSNLDTDPCEQPKLTIQAPKAADGTVLGSEPVVDASGVTLSENPDHSATLAFDSLKPGDSRQVLLTWSIPNFTVLPDTEIDTDGTLDYELPGGGDVTGVKPVVDPEPVTTTASPAINVTKTMVNPNKSDLVVAGSKATYRLTACLPGDTLGQLDYTRVRLTDTLTVTPAEPANSKATFTDLDGGTLSEDGRSLSWDIEITADNRPLCGTDNAIVKEVTVDYPAGMKPETPGDNSVANRTAVNNLDAVATLITNEEIKGHDDLSHSFTSSDYTGENHLQPRQDEPVPASIVKGRTDAEFTWSDWVNWQLRPGDDSADRRATAIFDSVACMTNVIDGVPTSLKSNFGNNGLPGIFADDANFTAPTLSRDVCAEPAFKTNSVSINVSGSLGSHHDSFRVVAYYWDTATNSQGSKVVTLNNLEPGDTREVSVYDNDGFGLSDTQTLTDVLAVGSPTTAGKSGWSIKLNGTQSESFAKSDYTAMTNHFHAYLSSVSSDGTIATVDDNAVENAPPTSKTKSFVKEAVIPSIVKSSSDDLKKLKPGDTVNWEIKVGNSDQSETSIKPTAYDVLPTGMHYVAGSAEWSGLDGKNAPTEKIGTVTIGGEKREKVTWTFSDEFEPGETASVKFKTEITIEAPSGSHSNDDAQFAAVLDQNGDINENLNDNDKWDLDEDGNTNERVQTSKVDWTITAESGATIEKFVKGSAGDGEWKTEDASIAALANDDSAETTGTDVDYRIVVSNRASNKLKNVVVYDVLPYVGDTGIGSSLKDDERGSEFQVDFAKLLGDLPAGVSVQYSTSNDASRPELFPKGDQANAADDWSDTLPSDPTKVRALRYVISELPAGQELTLEYRGTVPVFTWGQSDQVCLAETPLKAWNNVAQQSTTVYANGSERKLLPAEAPRVSIREVCGEIGDYAWIDSDNDGVQDEDEKPVAGVEFQLLDGKGEPVLDADGNPITTVTDENGFYKFDVPVGDWSVQVVEAPKGYAFAPANAGDDDAKDSDVPGLNTPTAPVSITPDHLKDTTLDAGFVPTVSVGDYVWIDTDNDGIQDDGEAGIPDVELTLTGPDGKPVTDVNGNPVEPVKTGPNGEYSFDDLPVLPEDQHYTVTVTPPAGYSPAKPNQGDDPAKDSSTGSAESTDLTKPGDRDSTLDFGFVPTVSVGDYVWIDTDNDGIQDDGEAGIPDVELTLTGPDGKPVTDVNGNPVEPVKTGPNGEYSFDDLPVLPEDQHYTVTVTPPAGYSPAKPNQGDDPAKDSSTGSAESTDLTKPGDRDSTLDFGFVPTVSVGDYVWIDTDNDGIQDDGEAGIPDVELTLTGPDGKPVTDVNGNPVEPVKTGPNGEYSFDDLPVLPEGSYTVTVTPPNGYEPAKTGQGDRATDSSTGSASTDNSQVDLSKPGARDDTLDFGFVPQVPVIDIEKYDIDGNDADTADESVNLPDGSTELTFTVTNQGNEELVDVKVSDEILAGSGTVDELSCVFPDGSTGTEWDGPFAVGESFDCTADLSGVKPGEDHADAGTVDAKGRWSGTPVTDVDEYHGHTPNPGIDIEKYDVDGNDADTVAETVKVSGDRKELKFTVKNTGDEPLKDVTVSDRVTDGGAKVENLVCTFPDGSTGTEWAGPFAVGDSFDCTAVVTGLKANDQHADIAKVEGTGVLSGKRVSDDDPYHAIRTPGLAVTGAQSGMLTVGLAGLLLLGGGVLLAARRRRHAEA